MTITEKNIIFFCIAALLGLVLAGFYIFGDGPNSYNGSAAVPTTTIGGVIEDVEFLPDEFVSIRFDDGRIIRLRTAAVYRVEGEDLFRACCFQIGERCLIDYKVIFPHNITGYRLVDGDSK